ncbi:MAG: hypothetical protein GTO63_30165 [Anaerolineae bacterium]|nr:hypothetical protein [Anaerolineae bacterium]NIN98970.1 hypothetical protein [Anaerolineae bacterium]
MSLVPDFTYCQDGKWYKELVYADESGDWYVCFDDSEPMEVVIAAECDLSPKQILDRLEIPYERIFKGKTFAGRLFPPDWKYLRRAKAYFVYVRNLAFPVPGEHCKYDQIYDEYPNREGVYYGMYHGQITELRR